VPALLLTIFIDTVGFGIVLPLLPYFAEKFGASPLQVTLLATVYSFTQFLFAPIWGRMSDRWGRRPIILFTLAGLVVGYLWLTLAESLLALFLARAFTGAMASNNGVIGAYITDITSVAERAKGMGRVGAAHGLGFIVGPAIGGLFAGSDPVNPDLQLPFLIAACLSAIALLIAIIQVRETVTQETRNAAAKGQKNPLRVFREAIGLPQLGLLLLLLTMTPFVFSSVETTFVIWSERALGWGPLQNGQIYTFMGLVAATTQWFLVGRLTRRFGEHRLIRAGAVLIGVGVFILPFMSGPIGLCTAFGFIVLGVSINNPSLNSLISQYAAPGERGSLLGVSSSCSALARITGPAWGGFAFGAFGRDWPFFSSAVVMILMFALALRLKPRRDLPGQASDAS
jgi:DHA1 family tetracycline resistance protein-like MFS transporter